MAIPYLHVNSMTYSSTVLTINSDYSHLMGGCSFSVIGFPITLTFSKTQSSELSASATYSSFTLSTNTTYNLTFSAFKSPYYDTNEYGLTGSTVYYQTNRVVTNFSFRT